MSKVLHARARHAVGYIARACEREKRALLLAKRCFAATTAIPHDRRFSAIIFLAKEGGRDTPRAHCTHGTGRGEEG